MSDPGASARRPGFGRTVRARMLMIALLPLLILLPLLLGLASRSWSARMDAVLIAKVAGELTIAHQHLAGLVERRGTAIAALGRSAAFQSRAGSADLAAWLAGERRRIGLDFLYYLPAAKAAGAAARWPVIGTALNGTERAAIDIFAATDLSALDPALAARARLALVATRAAVPTERREETRGMVVHAAAPAPGGVLVGGQLLNRNLGFIDAMNALVYPDGSLTGGSQGTTTIFLDDVRISTNVRLFADVRALGTRVSAAVRGRVLDEGAVWLDRAFVVNDWYVSAYEPVQDSSGARVGMLYVGFLEAPFAAAERRTLFQIIAAFLAVLAIAVPVLLRWARGIFAPLEAMNAAIGRVETGDLGARAAVAGRGDEIGRVAAHLDTLLGQLQERDRRLRGWADELERRVAERTSALEQANRQIEATTRQLIVSEKLAAIGEITAGVAHEINNPLAVIQGNIDVVRDDLGRRAEPLATEFRLIQDQIQAILILVSKLLRFARPEEFAETGGGHDPDAVIRDTLPLVAHVLDRAGVTMTLDLAAGHAVAMNATELQQVMVNLMINAAQAMPGGGSLTIATRPDAPAATGAATASGAGPAPMVRIEVADTGTGMPPEVVARIFDPFFTTKRAEGTGLGLSISRNLIARAGGDMTVQSTPGQGSRFTIRLPAITAAA